MTDRKERDPAVQALLVRAADGELDEAGRAELTRLQEQDPSLTAELEELGTVRDALGPLGLRDPNPDDWDRFENQLAPKAERAVGWLLMLGGYLALAATGLYLVFTDPEVPLSIKAGIGALAAGLAVLIGQVGRRFARERRHDPYKDVVR